MIRRGLALVVTLVVSLWTVPGALAHGEKDKTDPKENATVSSPPKAVSVTLTEPPTNEAVLEVFDGCKRAVVSDVSVDGRTIRATVGDGQPGRWRARFEAVSTIDGHPTHDRWTFTVKGKADCSKKSKNPGGNGGNPEADSAAPPGDDGGADFPVLPVVLGAIGLLALALLVRMTSSP
jgi:methionine-rich copper-binding protein CopC